MNRQSLNIQFFFVAGLAITASFLTEVWPDRYYWTMPLGIAFARLFIVAHTSRLKDLYDKRREFNLWSWGTTTLIAVYILHLWLFKEKGIAADVHWSLQVINVVLVGAEFYYGKLILKTNDVMHEENLKDQIADHENTIEENRETIDLLTQKIETIGTELEEKRKQIGSNRSEIATNRIRIKNQDSTIAEQKKEIEKLNKALVAHGPRIEAGQKLIAGIKIGSGTVIACPSCGSPEFIGHAAKSKNCKECKTVLK